MDANINDDMYGGSYIAAEFARYFDGPVTSDDWDVLWTRRMQTRALSKMSLGPRRQQRLVNHCAYFLGAGQKCYFAGHVRRVREALAGDPEASARFTHLRTFMLKDPQQFAQWQDEVEADEQQRAWVWKPCTAGMSEGIEVLSGQRLAEVVAAGPPAEWTVVQEYLHPYQGFGARKFHLRVYLLVTRWAPAPSALVFDEGVLFRSRAAYEHRRMSADQDVFSAISAKVEGLPHAALWETLDGEGSPPPPKRSAEVRRLMLEMLAELFGNALQSSFGDPERLDARGFSCFDLFGLDVMLDEELRPFVLEVNTGPNLDVDDRGEENAPLLRSVKGLLVQQLVELLDATLQASPLPDADARLLEDRVLKNFTRIL